MRNSSAKDVAGGRLEPQRHPAGHIRQARLHMRQTRQGTWMVRDEDDRRGGSFVTREAALKFIRREFGAGAEITATYLAQKEAA
jgi:hypothetical protein